MRTRSVFVWSICSIASHAEVDADARGAPSASIDSTAEAQSLGPKQMKLTFARYVGAVEQTLGAVEGLVLQYDVKPRTEVVHDGERAVFTVAWG